MSAMDMQRIVISLTLMISTSFFAVVSITHVVLTVRSAALDLNRNDGANPNIMNILNVNVCERCPLFLK